MVIGSGWKKKDKNGKQYLSIVIDIPFLGREYFLLYLNENKSNDSSPDYQVVWIPNRDADKTTKSGDDEEVPF